MDEATIQALEMALQLSEDNVILRKQIAQGYFALGNYEKAKLHLNIIIESSSDLDAKTLLAKCYAQLDDLDTALIICEDLIKHPNKSTDVMSLYLNLLIEDDQVMAATENYLSFQSQYPDWHDDEIESKLKVPQSNLDIDDDFDDLDAFMEKPTINFSHVGGMEEIKDDIRVKIIHPLNNPDLYKAFGKKTGGGILLFGPPGCGKTFLAKATAGEINSKFISVGLDDVMDMWMGNSEKNLASKFELARKNNPCVLFFDEIDALGSKRTDLKQSSGRNVINQFLTELDGVDSQNDGVLVLGATNSLWHMDSAFLRPGRFDRIVFVGPPDEAAREKILQLHLADKPTESIDVKKLAAKTDEYSGADIQSLIDYAVEQKLHDSIKSGKIEKLTTKDLLRATKKVRPSTKEWFNTARNYALYSNSSGLYDDILKKL
ncbi:AAA family ATPase [Owenweeksia hongkongensis]|uniref:AAA family ATPase n=1 Tax=Owenweeksia hongkongensis TaxID=253245 RepID=UPI003A943AC1